MTRVTIKELQSRLDEMRAQRDEARASANRLKGLEVEAERAYQLKSEMDACNALLDAACVHCPKDLAMSRSIAISTSLHARLASFLVAASATAGKLEQADLMRRETLGLDMLGRPFSDKP